VLGWIEVFQRGEAPDPPYPIEGTPAIGTLEEVAR
jgi:hypothetical protein